jgi:hypothetical protein
VSNFLVLVFFCIKLNKQSKLRFLGFKPALAVHASCAPRMPLASGAYPEDVGCVGIMHLSLRCKLRREVS